jgi:hypothetical protein
MSEDAKKLHDARAALLNVAMTILTVLKSGDADLILLAATSLENLINTPGALLSLESLEARRTTGLN